MTGAVFHPGHEPLHGVTVVVEGASGCTWVGRYHEKTDRGVLLHDVATHDPETATLPRAAWLERLLRFGVKVDRKALVVPPAEAHRITRLAEWDEH